MIHPSIPHGDREAHFSLAQPEVPVLLPGESVALAIATPATFFAAPSRVYTGSLAFEDGRQRTSSVPFHLSAEQYRFALSHESEDHITQLKLQQIPEHLKGIARAIESHSDHQRRAA